MLKHIINREFFMKRLPLAIVTLLIIFVSFPNYLLSKTFQNEPDGFRGIKWGTDTSALKGYYAGMTVFNKADKEHIGEAPIEAIGFCFWRGKFQWGMIKTKGYLNYIRLKDFCFEKYGKGYQPNENIKRYLWVGDTTGISLEYNEFSEEGTLHMYSIEITKQEEQYKQQQAKEGAKKDF